MKFCITALKTLQAVMIIKQIKEISYNFYIDTQAKVRLVTNNK